jgi:hypothetical protein
MAYLVDISMGLARISWLYRAAARALLTVEKSIIGRLKGMDGSNVGCLSNSGVGWESLCKPSEEAFYCCWSLKKLIGSG